MRNLELEETMKRLATDNVLEMDMVQLALNQVYIRGGWAQYRNGQRTISVRVI